MSHYESDRISQEIIVFVNQIMEPDAVKRQEGTK